MKKKESILGLRILTVLFCIGILALNYPPLSYSHEESALTKIQKRKVIKIGWANYPPYHDIDANTKQHVGAAKDVGDELGKFMDVKVEWVQDSWATIVAGVYAGKFDCVFTMDRTRQRYMAVGYSNWVAYSAQILVTQKKDEKRFKTYQDANKPGIKINCTMGTASDTVATAVYDKAELLRIQNQPDAMIQLVAGKVDGLVTTIETGSKMTKEYPNLRVADGIMTSRTTGFVTKAEDQVFINFLNFFIEEVRNDGTLKKIWKKWGLPEYLVEPEWKWKR